MAAAMECAEGESKKHGGQCNWEDREQLTCPLSNSASAAGWGEQPRWLLPRIRDYPTAVIPAESGIKPQPGPPPSCRLPISAL